MRRRGMQKKDKRKKNADVAQILFFNRMIYGRATIYRIAASTDDCFVFTVVEKKKKKKHSERGRFARFFCSYRFILLHLSLRIDHVLKKKKNFFFLLLFIKTAFLWLRFDFFFCCKEKGKYRRKGKKMQRCRMGQWFLGTTEKSYFDQCMYNMYIHSACAHTLTFFFYPKIS